jgi:probable HAF family extracellular repeat protein
VKYSLIQLGTLGGKTSGAVAINAAGQIAGSSRHADRHPHAFLYSDGKMLDLGSLGENVSSSQAFAINASGQVVGSSFLDPDPASGDARPNEHAFLYANGKMQDLGTLGGRQSSAFGINTSGQIVGNSLIDLKQMAPGNPLQHGFIYNAGKMLALDFGKGRFGGAVAINDTGQIAGNGVVDLADGTPINHGFIFSEGKINDLGIAPNRSSRVNAINASGQAVGTASVPDPPAGTAPRRHAFLYAHGACQDLGTLGGESSAASAINAWGQVVGNSQTAMEGIHAFLFNGVELLDLNTLVGKAALNAAGIKVLVYADGINDRGQIVGAGNDLDGNQVAFLLTPVDAKTKGEAGAK